MRKQEDVLPWGKYREMGFGGWWRLNKGEILGSWGNLWLSPRCFQMTAVGYIVRIHPCDGWYCLSRTLIKCQRDDGPVAVCCLHLSGLSLRLMAWEVNWLLTRAERIIWSTEHSLRTRVLVEHRCGHHEATPCLGWERGWRQDQERRCKKARWNALPQGLLEMESVAGTQVPKWGETVGYCMPSTFINLFSLLGTYFCPSSCSQTHSRLT